MTLLPDPEQEKKKEKKEKPQQMRYTMEVFCRGAVLWQETFFRDLSEIELGAFVAAIVKWAENPCIGGQNRIGMGRVKATMSIEISPHYHKDAQGEETYSGLEKQHFITVGGITMLSGPAQEAKQRYDNFLDKYAEYIEDKREALIKAIDGKAFVGNNLDNASSDAMVAWATGGKTK